MSNDINSMHLTKLSLALIRIAITLAITYILFSYGITQSLVTLGHIGDMSGWKLFTAAMAVVVYWGVGQVYRECKSYYERENNK